MRCEETFQINSRSRVVDLGCGSGDVALSFAQRTPFVEGVDSSRSMIDMAKRKKGVSPVTWTHMPVQEFDFGHEQYDLIFSYESFHLFPDKKEIIKKSASGLKKGGVLGVGWAMYAFDYPLKDSIEEVFAKNDSPWENWGEWTCPDLPRLVKEANVDLSAPQQRTTLVPARMPTPKILEYLFNVSKTASLDEEVKTKISRELTDKVAEIYPSGESVGFDEYSVLYFVKN